MNFVLDSNSIIEHVQTGSLGGLTYRPYVSAITVTEVLRFSGIGSAEIKIIERILAATIIIPVDVVIARRAAMLGRTRKTKLPDLFIAATALELDAILITKNVKDFRNIPKLKIQTSI